MTEAGARLIEAAKEAVAIAKGEQPAARIHVNGFAYVTEDRWQPIESAPKDGTAVLLHYTTSPFGGVAYLIEGAWHQVHTEPDELFDGWETPFGFVGEPTHWTPLPPLPSTPM